MTDSLKTPRRSRCFRWFASVAIAGFWLTMMGTLFVHDIWPKRMLGDETIVTPDQLGEDWQDVEEWMEVVYKDGSLGFIRTELRKLPTGDFLAGSRLRIVLPLLLFRPTVSADGVALLDRRLTLDCATLDAQFAKSALRVEAIVAGDALYSAFHHGEQVRGGKMLLETPPSFLQSISPLLARKFDLEVGKVYVVPVFDPLWNFGDGLATVRVVAREPIVPRAGREPVEAYKVETVFNGVTTVAWLDDDGRTLRQEIGADLALIRCSPDEATERFPELATELSPPEIDRESLVRAAEATASAPNEQSILGMLQEALQ